MPGLKDGLGGGTGTSTANNEVTNDIIITGTNRIYFRDAGISMYSNADGKLTIASDGSGSDDIIITGALTVTGATAITGATTMNGDVLVNLASTGTANSLTIKDTDGFTKHKLDAAGNISHTGTTKRV